MGLMMLGEEQRRKIVELAAVSIPTCCRTSETNSASTTRISRLTTASVLRKKPSPREKGALVVGPSSSTAEGEIRSEYHRTALVATCDDLEEQIGLLATHRQIADLVNDQQLVGVDRAMHDLAIAALALRGFEHQHQIGRTEEAGLVTLLSGEIAERDREVSIADARWSEEHHVLGALDE